MNNDYNAQALDAFEKAEEAMEGTEWGEDHYFRAQAFALISIADSLITLTSIIIEKKGE